MRLTIIGCSGSFPGPDSPASCYLLEADGFRLVLDLGNGAVGALQRYAAIDSINAICLSHLHADHCLDLCPMWVARTFAPDGALPPIPVYSPEGTAARMARAYDLPENPGMTERFDFVTLTPGTRRIGPFEVTTARMNHPVETFGFRFSHGGRSLAYSADTGQSENLVTLAGQADVLLCEASWLDRPGLPQGLHLTAREAVEHGARAGARRVVLTHLVPWNDKTKTLAEALSVSYDGTVVLANAGETLELR